MTAAAPLDVRVTGAGEALLLVHGGVDRDRTWSAQAPLAARWRLIEPARRGFPPSPSAERQDFEADARDLAALLAVERAHCVGFSYGCLGLALAVAAAPRQALSLTLIEPPLFGLAADRPAVGELLALLGAAAGDDPGARARAAAELEQLIAVEFPGEPEREADFVAARAAAPLPRPPGEARVDLAAIAAAGVPALIVSGDHHPAFEQLCDALADQLDGERARLPGAGHAIPHAPGFNDALERFLGDAGR